MKCQFFLKHKSTEEAQCSCSKTKCKSFRAFVFSCCSINLLYVSEYIGENWTFLFLLWTYHSFLTPKPCFGHRIHCELRNNTQPLHLISCSFHSVPPKQVHKTSEGFLYHQVPRHACSQSSTWNQENVINQCKLPLPLILSPFLGTKCQQ